ncbi:MAG: isopentenyl transferase family protein [Ruthenibacterium sp.]
MADKAELLVICGPTATGKTALSVALAQRLNGEIVCADSMQIYRGLSVGTAKVTPAEMQGVSHQLVDLLPPETRFSVADYAELAK